MSPEEIAAFRDKVLREQELRAKELDDLMATHPFDKKAWKRWVTDLSAPCEHGRDVFATCFACDKQYKEAFPELFSKEDLENEM